MKAGMFDATKFLFQSIHKDRQVRLIKSGIILASAASLLALSACSADKDTKSAAPASTEPAVATVNGAPISQRTVDMLAKQSAKSGHPDTPEARKVIVDRLTLQMVIAQEAIKKGLDKTPEVTEQIDAIKQTVLANAYVQDFIKNNPVTDDMVKAEYDRIKATVTGTEYKARHILVEKESEAKDIVAKLKKDPGAFEKLAMEKSKDQGTKANGGELGWFDSSRMVPEFGAAAAKLEKGKFTAEPVKTQFGYHVILLEDSRPIQAPPMEEVKPQLSQQLQQQNLMKQLEELKAKAKIEVAAVSASTPSPPSAPSPSAPAAPAAK
jgi:peptidyl-prolyl cis-trans isomerase C